MTAYSITDTKCIEIRLIILFGEVNEIIIISIFTNFDLIQRKHGEELRKSLTKQKNVGSSINLKINREMVTDQRRVANRFNEFFINVAQNLVDRLGRGNKAIHDYLLHPVKHTIFLKPTDASGVNSLISQLDETKATDFYGIPVKLVKLVRHTISDASGIFPEKLKLACITPIHKGNSKLALTNYRPISVLPVISKLLEQLMYERLFNFLNKNKILYDHQFGFQKKYIRHISQTDRLNRTEKVLMLSIPGIC